MYTHEFLINEGIKKKLLVAIYAHHVLSKSLSECSSMESKMIDDVCRQSQRHLDYTILFEIVNFN